MKALMSVGVVWAAIAAGSLAFAGSDAQQQQQQDIPNVLVVKVPKDKVFSAQQEGAQLVPLTMDEIPRDESGQIDVLAMAQKAHVLEKDAETLPLEKNNLSQYDVPQQVQDIFDQAQQQDDDQAQQDDDGDTEQYRRWRYYRPYRLGGFYGYSRYPYYGYNPYFRGYYPRYGYYYRGYNYPYYYSNYYYPYGSYYYYYYWR